jgi:alkanesulfonate monooxygenase SsuD/methylene tetrahydromethanopterin reductase-like flavin-dependent oxidoreductase (luciferase family)
MKFGIFYEFELAQGQYDKVTDLYEDYIRQVCFGEEHGFDSAWVLEHHFTDLYSYCSAPEVLLAALARHTSRIRLGSGVCLLPYHNPVTVAERYATLDHLCHGRLEFGIGRGVPMFEWDKFRAEPFEEGRVIMYEAMEVILKCWADEFYTHDGKYFQVKRPINVIPKPLQKPHPRIHAAASSPDSAAVYGEKGWEMLINANFTPLGEVARQSDAFRQARLSSRRRDQRGELSIISFVHCGPREQQADEEFKRYHKWFYTWMGKTYFPRPGRNTNNIIEQYHFGEVGFEDFKKNNMVVSGDPETCIRQIKGFEQSGVDRVMCQFRLGPMPHEEVMESMRLFVREVMPAFAGGA